MSRRVAALVLELRVESRYRIPAVALVVTAVWTLVLLAIPAAPARGVGPVVLLLDTATFGSFFIAALVLFERGEGALAALSVSPLRLGEYLAVKVSTLTALSLVSAVPIALAAGRGETDLSVVLPVVGLLAALFLLLNVAIAVGQRSITGFLTIAPLPLIPLLVVPLIHLAGFTDHPLVYLVPTTGAADLVRLGIDPAAQISPVRITVLVGYLLVATATATWVARQRFAHELSGTRRTRTNRSRHDGIGPRSPGWLRALVHIDLRTTMRSALLVVVLTGPILLALALRLGYPPLTGYLRTRFGVDLATYQPLLLATLVVLHVPMIIGMVGALLVLDDVDDRKVLVLRASPVTLQRYLAYRVVTVAVVAMIMLIVAVPASGLAPWPTLPGMAPALVLGAAQAPLLTLAIIALARNKVEGLAWLKILGLVPTGIAPAVWWASDIATMPLQAVPHYWTVTSLWHPSLLGWLIGATLTALATSLLARQALRRLASG